MRNPHTEKANRDRLCKLESTVYTAKRLSKRSLLLLLLLLLYKKLLKYKRNNDNKVKAVSAVTFKREIVDK